MPFAAMAPALIGAAGSIGSSLLNRNGGSGSNATTPPINQLLANSGTTANSGAGLLNLGSQNTQSGANFFRSMLSGNAADTAAVLQPDINRVNAANQQTLQAANNLAPRGAGRSSTLFSLPFQGNQQIQSLFNGARTTAAQALPQIGAGQTNAGANLFGVSNQGAGTAAEAALRQQSINNALRQGQGAGLFGIMSMPGMPWNKTPTAATPPFLPASYFSRTSGMDL